MGTKTLLDGVNDVLRRTGVIKGNSGALTSLTDSQRQVVVDLTVQIWNEVIIDLMTTAEREVPYGTASSTITLVTNTRDYALPSDLIRIRWPLQDETNGRYISKYDGGFEALLHDQPSPSKFTGLPTTGVIRSTDGHLYLNTVPTSQENGLVYTLLYDKSLIVSLATDHFPFNDQVYQLVISPVAEMVKGDREKVMNSPIYRLRMAQAASLVTEEQPRIQYTPDRGEYMNLTDPLEK